MMTSRLIVASMICVVGVHAIHAHSKQGISTDPTSDPRGQLERLESIDILRACLNASQRLPRAVTQNIGPDGDFFRHRKGWSEEQKKQYLINILPPEHYGTVWSEHIAMMTPKTKP